MKITQRGKAPERERERDGRDMMEEIDHNEMKREIISDTKREDKINTEIDIDIERERRETASGVGKNITRMCVGTERKNAFECGRIGHTKFMCGKVKRLTPQNTDSEADYSDSELYNMKLMRDELESDSDEFEQDGAYMCHTTKGYR